MYLSKIFIPLQNARNPYNIHRVLWKLFPHRSGYNRDFLFRVEKQTKAFGTEIIMQSKEKPATEKSGAMIIATREYHVNLRKGQRLRFRLRANPIKTITDERGRFNRKGKPKKCRVPLIKEVDQKAWFERKVGGFGSVEVLIIHREVPTYFRKDREQRAGKIQTVLYDGIISINNPETFLDAQKMGIGPAKAFGCGLFSTAKV
jgi:CRISPR system Cascade subunit CasE